MEEQTETEVDVVTHESPIKVAERADVKPQMVYNYIKKGYTAHDVVDGKIRVPLATPEDERGKGADEWVSTYLTRKLERTNKKAAQIEAELAGK